MDIRYNKLLSIQAETILNQAQNLQGKGRSIRAKDGAAFYLYYLDQIDELILQYNLLFPKVNKLLKEANINEELKEIKKIDAKIKKIQESNVVYNADKKLLKLIFGSSNILTFLSEGILLSQENQDRFDFLSKELEELSKKIEPELYENLLQAKNTLEKGCFLGSSLISGRIINACLNKITGQDINGKIETLKDRDLIRDKDGKDFILKANHFGRNITSHDLSINPMSSESLASLGDAITITKIYSNYNRSLISAPKKEETDSEIPRTE